MMWNDVTRTGNGPVLASSLAPVQGTTTAGGIVVTQTSEPLDVFIEDTASDSEIFEVKGCFAAVGIAADVTASYGRKSAGEVLAWIVGIGVPVGPFVAAFSNQLGSHAADGIRRVVTDIYEKRNASGRGTGNGNVVLIANLTVVLEENLPPAAYTQLSWLTNVQGIQARWSQEYACWQVCKDDFSWVNVGPPELEA